MPKTITDIIPPSRRRAMEEEAPSVEAPRMDDMGSGSVPPTPPPMRPLGDRPSRGGKKFPVGYAIAAVVVILASVGLLAFFGGAKVEATPVVKEASVSSSFTATPSSGDLPYETITVEVTAEKEISAEGEETVDLPAQGVVTIYNGQDKVQELIKNTRFETPEGLIFRIRDSIKVPAGTASDPGELTVTVYADAGGTTHNIGPSTFTLPGLAGSAVYDLVYAKSDAPMTGGFSGTRPSVAEATRASEYESMKAKLKSDLDVAVAGKILPTHALLPGATFIEYTPQPDGSAASDSVKLVQKGTATAYIFPREALAKSVAYATLGVYTGQPVTLKSVDGLTFTPEGGTPTPGMDVLAFTLSGNTDITWVVNTEEIQGAIAGKSKDAARTILAGFSELAEVRLVLKPFWTGSVPTDPSEIKVEVKDPEGK